MILLALLGGAPTVAGGTETPVGATATPVVGGSETPVSGDVDCDAFAAYLTETKGRIDRLEAIGDQAADLVNIALSDPFEAAEAVEGWATDTTALAEEQAGAEIPAGIGDLNERAVEALRTYAEAFTQLANGLSSLDADALGSFQTTLTQADRLMTQVIEDLNAFAVTCGLEGIEG